MAFNPNSTIYLCNVPIDNTYKHQVYFANRTAQQSYFASKVVKTFSNYLTVRKTLPGGSGKSSVKVSANIDDLYNCNYMYYQNANHGTRFFYAFITNLIYINEGTTEIEFDTDVFQTWMLDVDILPSFVVREHSATDVRGEHLVPENFSFQDYALEKVSDGTIDIGEWGYLVTATEPYNDTAEDKLSNLSGMKYTNIYQGLYFYFFTGNTTCLDTFLKNVDEDCIISISCIPKFNVSKNPIGLTEKSESDYGYREGKISYSDEMPEKTYTLSVDNNLYYEIDGYQPKNQKLFTSPYFNIVATNNNGQEIVYDIEKFNNASEIQFKMYGDISINPSLMLIPQRYNGLIEDYTNTLSITNFPQCSFNTDTFKMWLAKNQFGTALNVLGNVGSIASGVALTMSGAGSGVGAMQIVGGALGIANSINSVYQASKEPNTAHTGNSSTNLLTAINRNKFDFYIRSIKKQYAEIIDDYFTMFGYQVNKVKIPNLCVRPYYTYVQTANININGAIPQDDLTELKNIFNSGVTLWRPQATIGNYEVNNKPY